MRLGTVARIAVPAAVAAQWGPMFTSIAPLRRQVRPTLSGIGRAGGVALTYDDGPDPASTPHFLELLDRRQVTATFFLLGSFVPRNKALVAETAAAGHELAVHGWDHRCLAWKRPGLLRRELERAKATIEDAAGTEVRWFRPPYGVVTGEGLRAARHAGLQTVLWTAWGRDWRRSATPDTIVREISRALRPGGTALLHDTDRTSSTSSWRRTLAASEILLQRWADAGVPVRSLSRHGMGGRSGRREP